MEDTPIEQVDSAHDSAQPNLIHHIITTDGGPILGTLDLPFRLVPADIFYLFVEDEKIGESVAFKVDHVHVCTHVSACTHSSACGNAYSGSILVTVEKVKETKDE